MKILKEDLAMLNEDLGIFSVPFGLLALWAVGKVIKSLGDPNNGYKDTPGRPLPNSNAIRAMNDMWEDKPFIKDFAKILSDEGDIDELVKAIRTLKNSDKSKNWDYEVIWKMVNSTDFEPAPVAKRIVQRLLKTNSYKRIVRKYKLTKEDEQSFAKLLLMTIMRTEFSRLAKQYILKTIKPLGFLSKAGRSIDGLDLTMPDAR